jgi:hypothetical protein
MKFATEAERAAALSSIDEMAPDAAERHAEIISAEIGTDGEASTTVAEDAAKIEDTANKLQEETPPAKHEITDLKGYKTPGELLKAFDEAQALIQRQAEKIKGFDGVKVDPDLKTRLDKAEKDLAELRGKGGDKDAAATATADLKSLDDERKAIEDILDQLDRDAEADPDVVYTPEYQKRLRDANRRSLKNSAGYTTTLNQLSSDLAETKKAQNDFVANRTRETETDRIRKEAEAIDNDMDSLDDPDYKTTAKTKDLREGYLKWQNDVCLAFYGRPPKSIEEANYAMDQLQMKNPKLVEECRVRGTRITPDQDIERYLKKCELRLYQQGYRKNSAGMFVKEKRVMVPDGSGNMIPYIMPSLKDALTHMKAESGDYKRQTDEAYQQGATDFARAQERRDISATTLDSRDQTGTTKDAKWAMDVLMNTDELAIADAVRRGNKSVLSEINEARKILGRDPIAL